MAESYRVVLSEQADEDLNSILHYLLDHYGRNSALNAMRGIKECLLEIGKRPEAYGIWEPGIGHLNF
jgi:plasmid stabilization system protein ParE